MARRRGGRRHSAVGTLAAILGLLVLDGLLVAGDPFERLVDLVPVRIAVEFLVLSVIFVLLRPSRRLAALFGLLLLAAFLLHIASVAVPWYFGRSFAPASDLGFLPLGIGLAGWPAAAGGLGILLVAWAIVGLLVLGCWHAVRIRPLLLAPVLLLLMVGWALVPLRYLEASRAPVGAPASMAAADATRAILDLDGARARELARIEQAASQRPATGTFGALKGRTIILAFIESYGAITYTDAGFRAAIDPDRDAFLRRVTGAGYGVATRYLASPITGGGSWLAHATLLSGIHIGDQLSWEALLASRIPPLTADLRKAGYRVVAALPHLTHPWPEAGFYSYDRLWDNQAFAYAGPPFSWEGLPDQYTLDRIWRDEVATARQPVFAQLVLVSSHSPFDRIPPVLEGDTLAGDGARYQGVAMDSHPIRGGNIFRQDEGYQAAIRYEFRVLGPALEKLPADALVILLGDHQPPLDTALATRDPRVPVHVLTRDADLLRHFVETGFRPGMEPVDGPALPMENFYGLFVQAVSK